MRVSLAQNRDRCRPPPPRCPLAATLGVAFAALNRFEHGGRAVEVPERVRMKVAGWRKKLAAAPKPKKKEVEGSRRRKCRKSGAFLTLNDAA